MGKLSNNQLNDSHLDLTELDEIEKSLENSLVGKYHTRISYPGDEQYEADHRR
jgi:membrane-associated HD superfamily phosphohydrolase